jgi:hypothetical protein
MGAWNEDYPGSGIRLLEDCLHHFVMALVPVPAPLQFPAVDDVANQVKGLRVGQLKQFQQAIDTAFAGAQV